MGAIDEHRSRVSLEWNESTFEIQHVADALGTRMLLARTGKEEDTGESGTGDESEFSGYAPLGDPKLGHGRHPVFRLTAVKPSALGFLAAEAPLKVARRI